MIKVDISAFMASFQKYRLRNREKMKDTVWQVMRIWSDQVISLTPYGNTNSIQNKARYESRMNSYGWDSRAGLLMGNWNITVNDPSPSFNPNMFSTADGGVLNAQLAAKGDSFNLGDKIYLSNATPYLVRAGINSGGSIEQGYSAQAPNGLHDPLLQAIMSLHRVAFTKMN
jgi:hypothetical protein